MESVGEASNVDIQSVSRVAQILSLYGPQTHELTAADVADRIGLNRTTAYRYCTSLVAAGILERGVRRGTFALGGLMLRLGIQALGRRRVVEVAPPHLQRLSTELGVTAVLSLWSPTGPVVALVEEDRSRTIVVTVRAGTELDTTSAQMRVFLAYLTDPTAMERMLEGLGDQARAELEQAVYETRRDGVSRVNLPDGLFGAAAPVFEDRGICATVALLGGERLAGFPEEAIARLREAAAAIGRELTASRHGAEGAELR